MSNRSNKTSPHFSNQPIQQSKIPMKFNFKNFETSDYLRDFTESRLQFIAHKYSLQDKNCRTELWFQVTSQAHQASMRIKLPSRYLHISARGDNMYESVNTLMDKLESLIRKIKSKKEKNHRRKYLNKRNGLHSNVPKNELVALVS